MSTFKLSLLFFIVLVITGCSEFGAFEDRRREPLTERIYVGTSKIGAPAICYNPLFYNSKDIEQMADKLCKDYNSGSNAEFVKNDIFSCRLFVPSRAYYKCVVDK